MGHQPAQLIVDRGRRAATIVVRAPEVDVKLVKPVEALLEQVVQADLRELEIDLTGVAFADSSVVRIALKARDQVASSGGRVIIKAPVGVRRLFELTGTSELFSIVPVHSA